MLVSSLITVLGLAFVVGILYHYFQGQLMGELKKEAVYISRGVESAGTDYLKKLNDEESRITYVDESGKVIYDNEADVESMDNHGHRKEIREAEINGEGADERMSSTLSEKTMYYAVRLENGNVLRVSSNQASVWMLLLQLLPPFVAVLILMLLLSGVFASRLSGKVVEPLNGLDLEHPEENDAYDEVQPLLSKIGRQSRQIRLQLEAARRQQKEFSIITENMQEGLLVIDRYTMVLSVNSSVGKLLKVKEIKTGESVYLLNRSEEFRGVVGQALEGKHENKILRLGGSEIQVIANPVTRENKTEGAVILLVDVTEKVEREQLRREFSANVSHELKTPLTSIINYIDLLKRLNLKDPEALKYLEILDSKAHRLKSLTEDVVEASKASAGNLSLEMADLNFVEMLYQVMGEFEERMENRHLTLMTHLPDSPAMIYADGRRMWRILENLFGNILKYAMENTRVYAEVLLEKDQVIFTLKNISAQPLNIPAEELTERFIRGDVARNTEGSGLGLSIAQSLTQLQGGTFKLYLDGDLFKVCLSFPQKISHTALSTPEDLHSETPS